MTSGAAVDWAGLRASARDAARLAYAPYSGFPVGAAGLVDDGRVVVGSGYYSTNPAENSTA